MISLKDKTALITGGGAGIGRAIAEAYARAGATVLVLEVKADRAAETQKILQTISPNSKVLVGDVTKAKDIENAIHEVDLSFGKLDILVNNVGDYLGITRLFDQVTDEEIDRLYQVNFLHVVRMTRAAIPLLRRAENGASIINISSIEAFRGIPYASIYGAFKAALTGLTQSLALTYGPEGIRTNVIAPETTDTSQVPIAQLAKKQYSKHLPNLIPAGRFGVPEDAAGCALFLASTELSGWMNGSVLHLDGGALAAAGYYRTQDGIWTNTPVIVDSAFGGT